MREHGRSEKKNWLDNVILGFNFRMTEMQAAFGSAQLASLEKILKKGEKTAQKYSSLLRGADGIITPDCLGRSQRSWFTYFILFKNPADRNLTHEALSKAGIASSTNYFPPINKFPMYKNYRTAGSKNAASISKRLLTLPLFYDINDKQISKVVKVIKRSLK
jgi:dTDP-4-amino-4,6-dideoxygalactose transaminase